MFDFKSLDSAKKKAEIKGDKKLEQFYQLYDSALDKFRKLVQNQNLDTNVLKEIAYQLLEAIKLVKNQAEPYLFLAYIFYITGDKSASLSYLKVSNFLNSELEGIASLRDAIAAEPGPVKINYQTLPAEKAQLPEIETNNKRAPPKISPIRRLERK